MTIFGTARVSLSYCERSEKMGLFKMDQRARYDLDPTFSQRQQADYPPATALKPYQFNRISWLQK